MLDDTPLVPGDTRRAYDGAEQARQVLNDAEQDLRAWEPSLEPIPSAAAGMGVNLMPPGREQDLASEKDEMGEPSEVPAAAS